MSNVTLMQGDCLERMAEIEPGAIDMVLVDPPYGMDFQSQWKTDKNAWRPKIANDKRPFVWWMMAAAKAMKDGGSMVCFCRWDSWAAFQFAAEMAGLTVKSQIVWDKMGHGTGDLRGAPGNRHELAIFATKGRFTFHGKRPQSLGAFGKVSPAKLRHPNEKPVDLMEWLVTHYCPEGGAVLDPFAGVSPVGVACANTGRRYIGIELDPEYFAIASSRIEACT